MNKRILCVDDEPNILDGLRRNLRQHFEIDTAATGAEAMEKIAAAGPLNPYAVIVSDMRMPGMTGVELLKEAQNRAVNTVRMMLTGNADQQTAMDAVNDGRIFRFMVKPCPQEVLISNVAAGIEQHRLLTAERDLMTNTLGGVVRAMIDVLALVNPTAFSHASRVRRLVAKICKQLEMESSWQIEIAGMLSHLGCVTIPEETMVRVYQGDPLSPQELTFVEDYPRVGHDLIANIPRLEEVANIILFQHKHFDGSGLPEGPQRGRDIPLGARILKVTLDMEQLVTMGETKNSAVTTMSRRGGWYDPQIISALRHVASEEPTYQPNTVRVQGLEIGMILADHVAGSMGEILLPKGTEINLAVRERLKNHHKAHPVQEPIHVLVPM